MTLSLLFYLFITFSLTLILSLIDKQTETNTDTKKTSDGFFSVICMHRKKTLNLSSSLLVTLIELLGWQEKHE